MNKNLLLIFTRNPELGKVKTRLAKTIGDEKALDIYKLLLEKTKEVTIDLNCDKAIYYSVKIRENDIWTRDSYLKFQQQGTDLGERMQNAFNHGFELGYKKIIIVGSDLYDLTPEHITKAFKALDENDLVMGPAEDGGYYLLGMKQIHSLIFKNKEWGTSSVRKDTLNDLEKNKISLLDELNDIDLYEDLKKHDCLMKNL